MYEYREKTKGENDFTFCLCHFHTAAYIMQATTTQGGVEMETTNIIENKALCDEYIGKYPVIFLSLKSVEGLNFEAAKYRITELIGREAQRFDFLLESDNLSDDEKPQYKAITGMQNGKFSMDEDILGSSIQILSYFWNGIKDQ